MFLFFVLYHFMLPGDFYYGSEIRHRIFWGVILVQRFFWVLFEAQGIFLGFDFFPHSIIPVT